MSINAKLKQTIDELDLDRRANELVEQAEQLFRTSVAKVGDYAHEHQGDLERTLAKVSNTLDERTNHRFSEPIDKVTEQVSHGIAKVAGRRPADD